jgi:hypothetical protein
MPVFQDLLAKIKKMSSVPGAFFKAGLKKIAGLIPKNAADSLRKLFQEKRRLIIILFLVFMALFLLGLVSILLVMNNKEEVPAAEASRRTVIPPEELFLPNEPDFLPGVILEREPRRSWTAEDAAPFWQDPLRRGEESWRNRIESVIDEVLEEVP